jgi:histidine ammonia-lyase
MREPEIVLGGAGLTCAAIRRIARDRIAVRVDQTGLDRAAIAHDLVRALARRQPVYGRTTGVGANRLVVAVTPATTGVIEQPPGIEQQPATPASPSAGSLSAEGDDSHGLRLLRSHAGGAGPLVDPVIGRAMMVVRLNQLATGGSGVGPELLTGLAEAINRGLAPPFYTLGAIGTGDLSALAFTALCLRGELPWRGGSMPSVRFDPADAPGFLSSNAATIGEAALACADVHDLLAAGTLVAALAFLAVDGNPEAYDEFVHRSRPHPGQRAVATRLRQLLAGQPLKPARIQDPYSLRALPQVHGPALDAAQEMDRTLDVELNALSENPLVDVAGGRVLHNGNFHSGYLSLALDALRAAIYQTGALSVARSSTLFEPSMTGLPAFLTAGPAGSSGLMILEYVAHSALAELRQQAAPAALATAVLSRGVEEHAPFSTQAARGTTQAIAAYRVILAVELVAAVRALRMRGGPPAPGPLREAFDLAAAVLADRTEDRPLQEDVERAAELLTSPAILELCAPTALT